MYGDVWEWTEDGWHDNYKNAPSNGSAWISGKCEYRVLRGGSWFDSAKSLRSEYRNFTMSDTLSNDNGFRLVQDN